MLSVLHSSAYIVIICIAAALIIDFLAGDPYWFPHPVRFIGKYISWFEKLVRRVTGTATGLKLGGILLTITTVALTYLLSYAILHYAARISIWLYYFLNILLMYTCLAAKCLATEGMKIFTLLDEGKTAEARKQLSYIVGRDTENLDESEITRAAVETVAENTSDGVIAPLLYMFIGGAPLALAYKAVNTLDSMVGYKNDKYLQLGWASAKLDDLANFIPARLTAFFIVAAAYLMQLDAKRSFGIIGRDHGNHSSPNCGYPEAAVAGALGVQLGGTNMYFGQPVYKPTIGDADRPLTKDDIKATNRIMYEATVVALFIFSAAVMLWEKLI